MWINTPNALAVESCGSLDEWKKQYGNTKVNCECGGKYTNENASKHKKTNKHEKWEKEVLNKTPAKKTALSILLNHAGVSDDVISCHVLPWVEQFKFRDSPFPRILIDYTRIQNPNLFDEYNKLTDFEAALNIPQILKEMKLNYLEMFEGKFYGVLKIVMIIVN